MDDLVAVVIARHGIAERRVLRRCLVDVDRVRAQVAGAGDAVLITLARSDQAVAAAQVVALVGLVKLVEVLSIPVI